MPDGRTQVAFPRRQSPSWNRRGWLPEARSVRVPTGRPLWNKRPTQSSGLWPPFLSRRPGGADCEGRAGRFVLSSERRTLAGLFVFAILAPLSFTNCWYGNDPKELTAVSWGGYYTEASVEAYYRPFEESTGFTVRQLTYSGGLEEIRAQVTSGEIEWDVVDLEIFDAVRGCNEGLLEPIPWVMLAPAADGTPAEDDFLEDTTTECGVGASVYSTIYAYNEERFPHEKPTTVADFFDVARFPGRRGLRRSPQVNLEFALMADGVPPAQVYNVLRTPAGQERAFRRLDGLRDHIRWWVGADDPVEMLATGEVVMSTSFNGRMFHARFLQGHPFTIVWHGQVVDIGQQGIVRGTPRLSQAYRFVRLGSSTQAIAMLSRHTAYSPSRRSALPLVTTHVGSGVELAPHLPGAPENMGHALRSDWRWWSDNFDDVNDLFQAWLDR